jgi:hypothetical protein
MLDHLSTVNAAMLDFFQIFFRRGAPITHVARTRTGAHEAIS